MVMNIKELIGKMVTLYSTDLSDEYISGFILEYNEEELMFASVDFHGNNDGFVWLRVDGVYRIDYDSKYEKKLLYLYELNNQKHKSIEFESNTFSLLESLLIWAKKHKKMVSIDFGESDVVLCGYVQNVKKQIIKIVDRGECDLQQGYAWFDFQKTLSVRVDEIRSRDAELVFRCQERENV